MMNIGFYNIFGELKNAEQETLVRLNFCLNKQGHTLLVFDKNGFITSEGPLKGQQIETTDVDFIFTYNTFFNGSTTIPDVFSVFCHWSPLGFVSNAQTLSEIKCFNIYDHFAGIYETDAPNRIARITTHDIPFFGSSVPKDFSIPARKHSDRKLFYVGINLERKLKNMRYGKLLEQLDKTDLIDIYGPKKVFGHKNLWAGFKCYKGEIPFDGRSVLEKINKAGICLAFNSPMHNEADAVSNRTYEAAAAGALIISDENKFVRQFFGDSVFYIDINLPEDVISDKVLEIVNWANQNPDKAYKMAEQSRQIFIQKLSLDKMCEDFIDNVTHTKAEMLNKNNQPDVVDVVCYVNSTEEYINIEQQLTKQFYQNLHLLIITDIDTYKNIQSICKYDNTFVEKKSDNKGQTFIQATKLFKGNYFMFIDENCILHKRHIFKNLDTLKNFDELFCYSGCYMTHNNEYKNLNTEPISKNEFLGFASVGSLSEKRLFFLETVFSRSCAMFNKEILSLIKEDEITHITDNIHHYLACCSIIKANKLGRFTYACTTGYNATSLEELNKKAFKTRKHWLANSRSSLTYIKDMNEAFFKYTFEVCFQKFQEKDAKTLVDSKRMQKMIRRARHAGIVKVPRIIYEQFSLYCKITRFFKKIFKHGEKK